MCAWIGEQVAAPVGAAMAAARPATVRVIVPMDPPEAAHPMFVPLDLGDRGGPVLGGVHPGLGEVGGQRQPGPPRCRDEGAHLAV